jgi:hypothetical protein
MQHFFKSFSSIQLLALMVAGIAVFLLEPKAIMVAYIVLGHAHFAIAYLYKYKAGKIKKMHLAKYALLAGFVFSLPLFLSFDTILLIIAVLFSTHFFFDEARILEVDLNRVSLLSIAPPVIMFVSLVVFIEMGVNVMIPALLLSVVLYLIGVHQEGFRFLLLPHVLYLGFFVACFTCIYLFDYEVTGMTIFGSIILMHIATWYFFYIKKLKSNSDKFIEFMVYLVLINIIFIGLYYIFKTGDSDSLLKYAFDPIYYFCWAILHICSSSGELFSLVKERIGKLQIQ